LILCIVKTELNHSRLKCLQFDNHQGDIDGLDRIPMENSTDRFAKAWTQQFMFILKWDVFITA